MASEFLSKGTRLQHANCSQLSQILATFTAWQGQGKVIQWKSSVAVWQLFKWINIYSADFNFYISKHNRMIINMDMRFLDWAETSV